VLSSGRARVHYINLFSTDNALLFVFFHFCFFPLLLFFCRTNSLFLKISTIVNLKFYYLRTIQCTLYVRVCGVKRGVVTVTRMYVPPSLRVYLRAQPTSGPFPNVMEAVLLHVVLIESVSVFATPPEHAVWPSPGAFARSPPRLCGPRLVPATIQRCDVPPSPGRNVLRKQRVEQRVSIIVFRR